MELKINVKPHQISGKDFVGRIRGTKQSVLDAIPSWGGRIFSTFATNTFTDRNNNIIAYNLQKHRMKTKQSKDKKGKTKTTLVSPTYWEGNYYVFPLELLKIAKLKIVQHKHHFEIKPL